jgi:hypothetical protein
MDTAEVVSIIAVPTSFSQVQLFLHDEQLVLLAQRWVERPVAGVIDTSSKTDVIIYDISTPANPKLRKFADLDGWYQDARVVGDTLYVVSQVGINRRWYGQTYATAEDVKIEAETMLPKVIDIAYTTDDNKKNLTVGDTKYPYQVSVQRPSCAEMMYVLPTKESIKEYGLTPQFTLLRAIDLTDHEKELATTTTF